MADQYENKNAGELRDILKSITGELSRQRTIQAESAAEYRKMDSIARQLQDTHMGISNMTSEELNKLKEKNESHIKELQYQAQRLAKQKIGVNFEGEINQSLIDRLKYLGRLSTQEEAVLRAAADKYEIEKQLTEEVKQQYETRIKYEEKIKSLTGATGAILDSMNGTMKELGMGALSQYLEIDKAKKAMQEEADAIARGEKEGGRLHVRMTGLRVLAEGFKKALFSTEAIIGFIVGQLAKGSQNMADFRKQTGMSYISAYKLNMEMKGIAAASGDNFITSEKLNKSFAMLTQQLGVSADILGGEALVSATNLEQRLGMSAEQASKLTVFSRLQGKNTEDILAKSYAVVGAFNQQNKTALNVNEVMESVASTSMATYITMGKNVTALTKAASAAKALGLNMQQIEKIAESMLNFEDSIGKELEAQLLTGEYINLAKAREYALTGDMEGLTREIGKQEGILNAFRTKNVIAQKAAADALGITREELAYVTLQQDFATMSAEQFKTAYGETAYESVKARSATEKFGDALEKVKDILGSILQGFSPILDALAGILSIPLVPYLLAAVVVAKTLGGTFKGMVSTVGGLGKTIAGLFGKTKGGGIVEGITGASDKTKTLNKGAGEGIKGFLTGLAQGLTAVGKAMMTGYGAVGLAALTLALIGVAFALRIAAPGIEAFGKAIKSAFEGIATIIGAVADGFVKIINAVSMEKIAPMLLLGPALFGIAAGLTAVGAAGLISLPGLAALAVVSKIAPSVVSTGEKTAGAAKGRAEEGSIAALEAKFDTLIELVKQGTTINLDGAKIATTVGRNLPRVQTATS